MKKRNKNKLVKPFLKWAGGKTQLLKDLEDRLPQKIKTSKKIESYVEPFVGGGAFFFYLKRNYYMKKAIISDINKELIIGYKAIQNNPIELIDELSNFQKEYMKRRLPERKKFFYKNREKYNEQRFNFDYKNYNEKWIKRAGYLIFLNKTCFNGLFRLNKKGGFNVPFGKYKKPKICDRENILEVHKALQDTDIYCFDFEESKKYIKENALVYCDPPYRPLNSTSSFTSYSKGGFDDSDQKRLAKFYKEMHQLGAYLILSNSDPKNADPNDDFFDELYEDFNIDRVKANRMINCNGNKRGAINELIIKDY